MNVSTKKKIKYKNRVPSWTNCSSPIAFAYLKSRRHRLIAARFVEPARLGIVSFNNRVDREDLGLILSYPGGKSRIVQVYPSRTTLPIARASAFRISPNEKYTEIEVKHVNSVGRWIETRDDDEDTDAVAMTV